MTTLPVSEGQILDALHKVPRERWPTVLAHIQALQPEPSSGNDRPIRTAADLLQSGAVGMWADRTDIADSRAYARELRREAETRGSRGDAAGH